MALPVVAVSSSSVAVILILLLGHSDASSYFKPQCPIPPPGTNYVAGANTRSTLGILWDCLSIIILCTWNIQHLNVPAIQRRPSSILGRMWQVILNSRVKIKWMMFTILVPELLVGKALGELAAARSRGPVSRLHAYLANMGYFVFDRRSTAAEEAELETLGGNETELPQEIVASSKPVVVEPNSTGRQGANPPTLFGGVNAPTIDLDSLRPHARLNLQRLHHSYRYWALSSKQWKVLGEYGIASLYQVPRDQLERLDRGGTLVKTLALLQVSYLIVQLIARKVGGLPSTQLEITALAFAASSIITYLLYWDRPQGVESIHMIKAKTNRVTTAHEWSRIVWKLADRGPRYLWLSPRFAAEFDPALGPAPIPNDCSHYNNGFSWRSVYGGNDEILYLAVGSLAGGSIFGGLHCLAWNFDFPTPIERLLWRICSVMITCLPPMATFPLVLWMRLYPVHIPAKRGSPLAKNILVGILVSLFLVPYVVARLFLLVEIFRGLFFLPPEAFVDTWSGSFPHWG